MVPFKDLAKVLPQMAIAYFKGKQMAEELARERMMQNLDFASKWLEYQTQLAALERQRQLQEFGERTLRNVVRSLQEEEPESEAVEEIFLPVPQPPLTPQPLPTLQPPPSPAEQIRPTRRRRVELLPQPTVTVPTLAPTTPSIVPSPAEQIARREATVPTLRMPETAIAPSPPPSPPPLTTIAERGNRLFQQGLRDLERINARWFDVVYAKSLQVPQAPIIEAVSEGAVRGAITKIRRGLALHYIATKGYSSEDELRKDPDYWAELMSHLEPYMHLPAVKEAYQQASQNWQYASRYQDMKAQRELSEKRFRADIFTTFVNFFSRRGDIYARRAERLMGLSMQLANRISDLEREIPSDLTLLRDKLNILNSFVSLHRDALMEINPQQAANLQRELQSLLNAIDRGQQVESARIQSLIGYLSNLKNSLDLMAEVWLRRAIEADLEGERILREHARELGIPLPPFPQLEEKLNATADKIPETTTAPPMPTAPPQLQAPPSPTEQLLRPEGRRELLPLTTAPPAPTPAPTPTAPPAPAPAPTPTETEIQHIERIYGGNVQRIIPLSDGGYIVALDNGRRIYRQPDGLVRPLSAAELNRLLREKAIPLPATSQPVSPEQINQTLAEVGTRAILGRAERTMTEEQLRKLRLLNEQLRVELNKIRLQVEPIMARLTIQERQARIADIEQRMRQRALEMAQERALPREVRDALGRLYTQLGIVVRNLKKRDAKGNLQPLSANEMLELLVEGYPALAGLLANQPQRWQAYLRKLQQRGYVVDIRAQQQTPDLWTLLNITPPSQPKQTQPTGRTQPTRQPQQPAKRQRPALKVEELTAPRSVIPSHATR